MHMHFDSDDVIPKRVAMWFKLMVLNLSLMFAGCFIEIFSTSY